jgi:methionyl-tRNA formyltransferase
VRILFAGSPAIAVPSLELISALELEGKEITLAGILTNPDSRKGRSGQEEPTDVSAAAAALDAIRIKRGLPLIPQ